MEEEIIEKKIKSDVYEYNEVEKGMIWYLSDRVRNFLIKKAKQQGREEERERLIRYLRNRKYNHRKDSYCKNLDLDIENLYRDFELQLKTQKEEKQNV